MAEQPDNPIANSVCENCGAAFHCGMGDDVACWCESAFPKLLTGEAGQSCLCPDCLRARIAALGPAPT